MKRIFLILPFAIVLILSACSIGSPKQETNYYVLDYQPSSEKPELVQARNNGKVLHVSNTSINRAYNRNQLVEKENMYKVNYLKNEMWANRLSDAVPNLITSRLRAYNIFGNVTRNITESDPHYYLETNILNIEKIKDKEPRAFLRIEFVLRDSMDQKVILEHKSERYKPVQDDSYVSLVQHYNTMLMEETNLFAAKCIAHFEGRSTDPKALKSIRNPKAHERVIIENLEEWEEIKEYGELLLQTKFDTSNNITYKVEHLDSLDVKIAEEFWYFNEPLSLLEGSYRVHYGEKYEINELVAVYPRQRSVLTRNWCELKVKITDNSQNRVRQLYRIWRETNDEFVYEPIAFDVSPSEDEHGTEEKVWILPEGKYMLTLGGSNWSDLKDFSTLCLREGDAQIFTVIVNRDVTRDNLLVGAGVLADDFGFNDNRTHKGAIHLNVNLTSNNEVDEKDPIYSLRLDSKFDNSVDYDLRPFHYKMRSIYDLQSIFSKDIALRFERDNYNLKNTLMLYPWKKEKKLLGRFAFYGRADLSTHLMDEYTYFTSNKNIILKDLEGNEVSRLLGQDKFRSKIALFPLRLKEGTGLTYHFPLPNASITLRGGYGWQQNYNKRFYSSPISVSEDGEQYDAYQESPDQFSDGVEATLILAAGNILNFVSVNSIFEALFPFGSDADKARFENENTINFRIYRNISVDLELKLSYNESERKWLMYDLNSYLKLSLFY
ncbi:MAG: ABC-type transport auxiliary lipoprotein family protein [Candidatus Cloacimonadaceae bacterium]